MLKAMGQAISKTVAISEILKVSALSHLIKSLCEHYHLVVLRLYCRVKFQACIKMLISVL